MPDVYRRVFLRITLFGSFLHNYRFSSFLSLKMRTFRAILFMNPWHVSIRSMQLVKFPLYFCRQKCGLLKQFWQIPVVQACVCLDFPGVYGFLSFTPIFVAKSADFWSVFFLRMLIYRNLSDTGSQIPSIILSPKTWTFRAIPVIQAKCRTNLLGFPWFLPFALIFVAKNVDF